MNKPSTFDSNLPTCEGAVDSVSHIRSGALNAETYLAGKIEICHKHAHLNALSWTGESAALSHARKIDATRARGETLGRLAGLALVIKDNIDTVGFPTSSGTSSLRTYYPRHNAPVVQTILDEGAVVLGKGNMHELAAGGTSANPGFGVVRNPYATNCISGGSSGGTAVAIRTGMASLGLGTDTAGSVRIPAAFCGLVGLRPSTAPGTRAYGQQGVVPLASALDTIGPMGLTMADVALLHAIITGTAVPIPAQPRTMRLGVPYEYYWDQLEADVEQVSLQALEALRQAGATLVPVNPNGYVNLADKAYAALLRLGLHRDMADFLQESGSGIKLEQVLEGITSPDVRHLYASAAPDTLDIRALEHAIASLDIARDAYATLFAEHELSAMVFPTTRISAPLLANDFDQPDAQVMVNDRPIPLRVALTANTRPTGALGVPGLTLPVGLTTTRGMPVGLEFDGVAGHDTALLALGMAVEACLGKIQKP